MTHGGPKYKVNVLIPLIFALLSVDQCALEHGIPIVQPSWIAENYDIWLHGDDVETDLENVRDVHGAADMS